jgi:hypothetical protein
MTSQSENSVSQEFGELLQLLNALETQDSRPIENFATLERLLAAGKVSLVESFSDDHASEDCPSEDHQPDDQQSGDVQSGDDHQPEVGGGISNPEEPSSSEELIAQRPDWHADEGPEAEPENRLAVHIIQGLRKSIKDWTS